MAAKMSDGVLNAKLNFIDDLEREFHEKLTGFASDVKTKMQTSSQELANQVFELTLLFLTQAFPNIHNMESTRMESSEDIVKTAEKLKEIDTLFKDHKEKFDEHVSNQDEFKERLRKLESKFEENVAKVEKKQEKMEDNVKKVERKQEKMEDNVKKVERKQERMEGNVRNVEQKQERMEDNVRNVEQKQEKYYEDIKEAQEESQKNIEELKESLEENSRDIAGLRRLQSLFKTKLQESKTTTSPQQMPTTTTSTSSPQVTTSTTSTSAPTVQSFGASAAAATLSGAPLSLSQTSHFKIQVRDNKPLSIWDVKFVSSTLLLVSDRWNNCVRLFYIKGQELDTLECESRPWFLAILMEKAPNCWSAAMALPDDPSIRLLEINNNTLSMKSVIKTQRKYDTIAAVSSTTLAAGYSNVFNGCSGVDLINISGTVLLSICSGVSPWCMVTTEDQCLIVLDYPNNTFYKFNLQQGTQDIKRDISKIEGARSIARLQSGCFVVADSDKKVLHLVGDDGQYKRVLWKLPSGGDDDDDYLRCVTIHNNVCVCCTDDGSVYVFNVQGDQIQ